MVLMYIVWATSWWAEIRVEGIRKISRLWEDERGNVQMVVRGMMTSKKGGSERSQMPVGRGGLETRGELSPGRWLVGRGTLWKIRYGDVVILA